MEFITLLILAVGVSMDAFAVSVSNGLCYRNIRRADIFKIAFTFGAFQAVMPLIGYFLGRTFSRFITTVDHWVALFLLVLIGIHMIFEAVKALKSDELECPVRYCTLKSLLTQGVATSIDALAIGISFAVLETNIYLAVLFIGVITFIFSSVGVILGKKIGRKLSERAEIFGGLILIGIGLKIFIEHMFYQ
jgi:manganese efflux pump family protein